MNVRFFAGTKAEYLSLPVPHNPLGLYFCEDTKELFWADGLLTDGTRVVPTFKDLPSFEKAADGIIYFVEETRNGYVLSSDRTDWVQVIYAPATESPVKAISFAGTELEEVNGVFTIDRRCAREALGFKVPEGMEDEEFEIASTDYVTKAIAAINPTVEEVKTKLDKEVLPIIPTVQKVETEVIPVVKELAEKAATQEWVEEQGYLTAHQSLEEYAKKSDIPSVEGFASEEFVLKKIAEAELADQDVDLSAYYTKSETEAAIKSAVDAIDVPDVSNLATKEELEAVQNVAGSNSVKLMQLDSDLVDINAKLETIPSIEGLATETYVDEKFAAINIPDVSNFITMEEVEAKGYINEVPAEYITENELEAKGYLTEHQDLTDYAKKSDIPSTEGLASEAFVEEKIAEKANDIPFTTDKFVGKAIGGFAVGANVKGLTIAEILAKLLELTDEPGENPDTPDEPGEPTTIPDKIIANNSAMYQVNELGEVVEIPYSYKEFTADEHAAVPTQDCFYQLKDAEGNVIESGYQHVSEENDSMYYLILLPKELDFNSNISVKCWNAVQNQWSNYQLEMINDLAAIEEALAEAEIQLPEYDSEKYTLWIDSSLDTCSGIDYRFIINE